MTYISFQWDKKKNLENIKKHRISFDEARTAFYDENARLITDAEHSTEEERFILLGLSNNLRLLIVVHAYRENDEIVRIISARKATKSEANYYWKGEL